ncbi:MAG: nucleotide exchange factor GrpE [Vicinamibacterales bacterium]
MVDDLVNGPTGEDGFEATATDAGAESIEALRKEKDSLQDRLLRTAAEFDNFRKRIERERREHADHAATDLLSDILPVVDDLERALQAPAGGDADAYRKGVELIHRQLLDVLRRRGVKTLDVTDADFDPRFHQAVAQEASTRHREGQVIEELRRGYMLGERLLRAAMVKVATRE